MSSTASPLDARRARIRQIRARVAVGAAAAFVGVFGFLFGQLSSGNDPGLTDNASTSAAAQSTQSDDNAATTATNDDQTWSADSPAPVQTGQS
jgi:hypothetical protein